MSAGARLNDQARVPDWDEPPLLPALHGGGIFVTQCTSQRADTVELGDDALSGCHAAFCTFRTYECQRGKRAYLDGTPWSMKNAPADTLAHYLNQLRIRAGLSVRALAEASGYAAGSSVQRYLEDPTIDRLSLKAASKIANALYGKGRPPIELSDLAPLIGAQLNIEGGMTDAALAGLLQLSVVPPVSTSSSVQAAGAGKMPVIGAAHASFWMPSAPSLDEAEDWLTIPFGASAPLPGQYALRIVGPSINRVATEGMFAICEQFANGGTKVPEGKYVHAQRERHGEIEWTLKLAKWTADGLMLCPNSDHKDHQMPLKYGDDGDTVTILGVVIGWYRPA